MTELVVQPPPLPDTWLTSDAQDERARPGQYSDLNCLVLGHCACRDSVPCAAEPLVHKTCQQCRLQAPKYSCPACSFRSCSLGCSQDHKAATGCSGKRSRTAFVSLGTFSDRELLSDYRLLEETARAHDVAQRTKPPAPNWWPPKHLEMLRDQVRHCQVAGG